MKQAGRFILLQGIETMSFSPDGHRLLIADSDGTARVWNADTGDPVTPPLRHQDAVDFAAFSHDARWVVTTSRDRTARVWDASTGQPITGGLAMEGPVDSARFIPGDRFLQTLCHTENDGAIATWELKPDPRPAKELVSLAESLSLHRLDSTGSFVPLVTQTNTSRMPDP
jgi:WD40 repeat protein